MTEEFDVLEDLYDRTHKASQELKKLLSECVPGSWEHFRLRGKVDGVLLALSYIDETRRTR